MDHKDNTVDNTLVEDYMTTTTVTMYFKNSVLENAKKLLAENISSIPITDEVGKLLVFLQHSI